MAKGTTKQQLELMEALKASGATTFAELEAHAESMGVVMKRIFDNAIAPLDELLGKQAQFATEKEKLLIAEQSMLKLEQEKLKAMREVEASQKSQERLQEKINDLQAAYSGMTDDEKRKATKKIQDLKDQQDHYDDQIKTLKEINKLSAADLANIEDATNAQLDLIDARERAADTLEETTSLQGEARAQTENMLEGILGAKDGSEDMADVLIDMMGSGAKLEDIMEGISSAYSEAFTKKNLFKAAKNQLKDFTSNAKTQMFSIDGVLMQHAQMDEKFTQSTGAAAKYGKEVQSLAVDLNGLHFTMEETNRAYETLYTQSQAFSNLEGPQRKMLATQAAQFTRIGVAADTFAASIDGLNKIFGDTPEEVGKTTEEISNFARALGVGPNEMLSEFNKQLPLLARYGKSQGVKMFKQLAVTAKRAGVEMSDLLNVAAAFDTFEGAADAAGKLNFMLGGPMINSMEMLNATEEDRIEMLRQSMIASGKSFDQMGRFEKDLIAKTLGVGVDVAQKIFSDENIGSIEDANKAIEAQAAGFGSVEEQAASAATAEQKRAAAQESMIATMNKLGPVMEGIQNAISEAMSFMNEWAPIIAIVEMAFTGLTAGIALFGKAGVFAGTSVSAAFWPITLVVLAIVAAIALVYIYFDDLVDLFEAGITAVVDWFVGLGDIFTSVFRSMGNLTSEIGTSIMDFLGGAVDFIVDKFVWMGGLIKGIFVGIFDFIKGLVNGFVKMWIDAIFGIPWVIAKAIDKITELAADAANTFLPGPMEISGTNLVSQVEGLKATFSSAVGYEEGGTNIKGGAAIVGEGGPELVTLPQGSNVVTNENLNRLMGQGKAGPAGSAPGEQTINITLQLDKDVLARHTAKTTMDEITRVFAFDR